MIRTTFKSLLIFGILAMLISPIPSISGAENGDENEEFTKFIFHLFIQNDFVDFELVLPAPVIDSGDAVHPIITELAGSTPLDITELDGEFALRLNQSSIFSLNPNKEAITVTNQYTRLMYSGNRLGIDLWSFTLEISIPSSINQHPFEWSRYNSSSGHHKASMSYNCDCPDENYSLSGFDRSSGGTPDLSIQMMISGHNGLPHFQCGPDIVALSQIEVYHRDPENPLLYPDSEMPSYILFDNNSNQWSGNIIAGMAEPPIIGELDSIDTYKILRVDGYCAVTDEEARRLSADFEEYEIQLLTDAVYYIAVLWLTYPRFLLFIGVGATIGVFSISSLPSKALSLTRFKLVPSFIELIGKGKETEDGMNLRMDIERIILSNPGIHFNAIRNSEKLGGGQLSLHLRLLEKKGTIRGVMNANKMHYFHLSTLNLKRKDEIINMAPAIDESNRDVLLHMISIKSDSAIPKKQIIDFIKGSRWTKNRKFSDLIKANIIEKMDSGYQLSASFHELYSIDGSELKFSPIGEEE